MTTYLVFETHQAPESLNGLSLDDPVGTFTDRKEAHDCLKRLQSLNETGVIICNRVTMKWECGKWRPSVKTQIVNW